MAAGHLNLGIFNGSPVPVASVAPPLFVPGSIHLPKSLAFWEKDLQSSDWVLDLVINGYRLPFQYVCSDLQCGFDFYIMACFLAHFLVPMRKAIMHQQ